MVKIIHVVANPSYRDVVNAACELYLAIAEFEPQVEQSFIQMQPGALGYPEVPGFLGGSQFVLEQIVQGAVVLFHYTPTLKPDFTAKWHSAVPVISVRYGTSKSVIDNRYRGIDTVVSTSVAVAESVARFASGILLETIPSVSRAGQSVSSPEDKLLCGKFVSRFAKYADDWLPWCSRIDLPLPMVYENIGLGVNLQGRNTVRTVSESLSCIDRLQTIRQWALCLHEAGEGEGSNWGIIECLSNGIPVLCNERSDSSSLIRDGVNGYVYSTRSEALSFLTDFCLDPSILTGLRENTQKIEDIQLKRSDTAKRYVDIVIRTIARRS